MKRKLIPIAFNTLNSHNGIGLCHNDVALAVLYPVLGMTRVDSGIFWCSTIDQQNALPLLLLRKAKWKVQLMSNATESLVNAWSSGSLLREDVRPIIAHPVRSRRKYLLWKQCVVSSPLHSWKWYSSGHTSDFHIFVFFHLHVENVHDLGRVWYERHEIQHGRIRKKWP